MTPSPSPESPQTAPRGQKRARKPVSYRNRNVRAKYSNAYRELLNETIDGANFADAASEEFGPREREKPALKDQPIERTGISPWSDAEKNMFFRLLDRFGRTDLRRVAAQLRSKSEVEVHEYVLSLKQGAASEDHSRRRDLRRLRLAERPLSSAEISKKCCRLLDEAATSLDLHQRHFESRVERERFGDHWLVNVKTAAELDVAVAEEQERKQQAENDDSNSDAGERQAEIADSHSDAGERQAENVDSNGDASEGGHTESPTHTNYADPRLLDAARLLKTSRLLELSARLFMNSPDARPGAESSNWQSLAVNDKNELPSLFATAFIDLHSLVKSLTRRLVSAALFEANSRLRAQDSYGGPRIPKAKRQDVLAALHVLGVELDGTRFWLGLARRCKLDVYETSKRRGKLGRRLNYAEVEARLGGTSSEHTAASREDSRIEDEKHDAYPSDSVAMTSDESELDAEELDDQYLEAVDRNASIAEERRLWAMLRQEPPDSLNLEAIEVDGSRRSRDDLVPASDWRDYMDA